MSHSNGEVWKDGELVAHFEYNGTTDVACSRLYPTFDEMYANWCGDHLRNCVCGQPSVDVILWTSYGGGFYWPAEACLRCMAITDWHAPECRCGWGEKCVCIAGRVRQDGHPFPEKVEART